MLPLNPEEVGLQRPIMSDGVSETASLGTKDLDENLHPPSLICVRPAAQPGSGWPSVESSASPVPTSVATHSG